MGQRAVIAARLATLKKGETKRGKFAHEPATLSIKETSMLEVTKIPHPRRRPRRPDGPAFILEREHV